jgi:beta-glucanase (GH16 family)
MPTGDLPGWRQVFSDDFNGSSLDSARWGTYSGQPGGSGSAWSGWWSPSHWVVGGGQAVDRGYRDPVFGNKWTTAGAGTKTGQQYGKYEIRFRIDAGYGIVVALLLWPSDNRWPPEIDFAENAGATSDRPSMTATLHYSNSQFVQDVVRADFTQWHTIGVEWTAGKLVYTLDGNPWATRSGSFVPAEPMDLALQTQAGKVGDQYDPAPDSRTPTEVDLDLDWVSVYAPA